MQAFRLRNFSVFTLCSLLIAIGLGSQIQTNAARNGTAMNSWHEQATQSATSPQTLQYGQSMIGQITNDQPTQNWPFTVTGRDVVSIHVERDLSGADTLVPMLELHDSTGKVLANADHDETASQATIESAALSAAGTYTVVVGRYQGTTGKTEGHYRVELTLLGTGPDSLELLELPQPLGSCGGQHTFDTEYEVTNKHWAKAHFLCVEVEQGQQIRASVTRTDGTLIPSMRLIPFDTTKLKQGMTTLNIDINQNVVASADAQANQATVVLKATAPTKGLYLLLVMRKDGEKGVTIGKYKFDYAGPSGLIRLLDKQAIVSSDHTLKVGQPTIGFIQPGYWFANFRYKADTTTPLDIRVQRTKCDLIPAIKVFDATGQEIASAEHDETFAVAALTFTPPQVSDYFIVVYRQDQLNGLTTGSFSLTITPKAQ